VVTWDTFSRGSDQFRCELRAVASLHESFGNGYRCCAGLRFGGGVVQIRHDHSDCVRRVDATQRGRDHLVSTCKYIFFCELLAPPQCASSVSIFENIPRLIGLPVMVHSSLEVGKTGGLDWRLSRMTLLSS